MLDRPRVAQLSLAAVCLVLFVVLAIAVDQGWQVIRDFDERGDGAQAWAVDADWAHDPLRIVELIFNTIGVAIMTAALATLMFVRGHRRAAYFTVGVMVATSLTTTGIKLLVGRDRPPWQSPVDVLTTHSFPSGHASSVTALAGVVMVLVGMLVRRANVRRLVYVLAVLVVVLVCLDRVYLGRHYPSDVIGGVLLGAFFVLLGIAVYSPIPRSHAESAEPLPEVFTSERQLAVVLNGLAVAPRQVGLELQGDGLGVARRVPGRQQPREDLGLVVGLQQRRPEQAEHLGLALLGRGQRAELGRLLRHDGVERRMRTAASTGGGARRRAARGAGRGEQDAEGEERARPQP